MRDLTRKERCAVNALADRTEHNRDMARLVVEDYARAAHTLHETRRRLSELTIPAGREDDTGFAPGCVY